MSTAKVTTAKRYAELAARCRVPAAWAVILGYAAACDPSGRSLAAGLPLVVIGLLVRAWAAGHIAKNEALATTGPFAYTRNPLYLGTLLVAAGFAAAGRNPWLAAVFALYFAVFYLPAIREEEGHLRRLFPEYAAYESRVPRVLPRFSPAYAAGRFQWSRYLRNQEYRALLGCAAMAALLAFKLLRC